MQTVPRLGSPHALHALRALREIALDGERITISDLLLHTEEPVRRQLGSGQQFVMEVVRFRHPVLGPCTGIPKITVVSVGDDLSTRIVIQTILEWWPNDQPDNIFRLRVSFTIGESALTGEPCAAKPQRTIDDDEDDSLDDGDILIGDILDDGLGVLDLMANPDLVFEIATQGLSGIDIPNAWHNEAMQAAHEAHPDVLCMLCDGKVGEVPIPEIIILAYILSNQPY